MTTFKVTNNLSVGITFWDSNNHNDKQTVKSGDTDINVNLDESATIYLLADSEENINSQIGVTLNGSSITSQFSTVEQGSSSSDPELKCGPNVLTSFLFPDIGVDASSNNITVQPDHTPI